MSAEPVAEALVWLVRHAEAGDRERWRGGPDGCRPLDARGRRQAEALAGALRPHGVDRARRVVSSPAVRCVETVAPLARALGLRIEEEEALLEGAAPDAAAALLGRAGDAVLCTHGDVMEALLGRLARAGVAGLGEPVHEKGCTWVLRLDGGHPVAAEYVPPPG